MKKLLHNKTLAAKVSVFSNSSLIILKFAVGIISGSISIISEAIHSCSDLLASVIALFSVNKSEQPADSDHQFGHGKYEDFSGLIEGSLIILAALYIIYEVIQKLLCHSNTISNTNLAIAVMFASVLLNIIVSSYIFVVAKNTDSIALFADAEHLRTDIYSSLAVFLGLVCIKFTGLHVLDPVIAIIVAVIIIHAGWKICKEATNNLLDGSLPEQNIETIKELIEKYKSDGITGIKDIKTRKSGKNKDIIITLFLDGNKTITYAHTLCDKIEKDIENTLGNTDVTIHVEPMNCAEELNTAN